MSDPKDRGLPKGNASNWSAGFLPGAYQGTWLRPKGAPIHNLSRPEAMTEVQQRSQLDLIAKLNARDAERNPQERELAARIQSFELAYRMQSAAPEALAVENEPAHMQELYGLHSERCGHVARQCIIARRAARARRALRPDLFRRHGRTSALGTGISTSAAITPNSREKPTSPSRRC